MSAASPRWRTLLAAALCALAGALTLPWGFQALLPMSDRLLPMLVAGYLSGAALITLVVAITAWVALWPATPYLGLAADEPEPRGAEPQEAKAAALGFPARVANAGTASGELAVAAGWLALTVAGEPPVMVLGISLITAALVALLWLLLHALAQRAVAPLLVRLREVQLAPGELLGGASLRGRLSYALAVVVCAGVLPAAVFATAYLDRAHHQAEAAQARRTAARLNLAVAGPGLDQAHATAMIESVALSRGFAGPWPDEGPGRAGEERPTVVLPGGKRLYLPPPAPPPPPTGIFVGVSALLLLGVVVAQGVGRRAADDVIALTSAVREYSEARAEPRGLPAGSRPGLPAAGPVLTSEALRVQEALERLMDRMRRLHVDSYLAIERTVDARRAKSQFLASMSHDLRSPLSSVLGFAELLTGGFEGDVPEAARQRLLQIHKTGRRLLRLLAEILDTAKVESQTIELHPRPCAPGELLTQAITEARRGRLQEELPVVLDIMPGLRPIAVDPVRFPQALAHLIGHVLDGTAADPLVHQLRVSAREAKGEKGRVFVVEVAVERASQPGLWRSPPSGAEPVLPLGTVGLGLALPLARRLIALHGGTIEVAAAGGRQALVARVPLK